MSAEQKARRTAAAAALADYRRDEQKDSGELVWAMWAGRLAAALESVLAIPPAGLPPAQLATVLDALEVAADYKRDRAATCPDCESSPAGLCGTCEWRLARADEYDALAEALRGQR